MFTLNVNVDVGGEGKEDGGGGKVHCCSEEESEEERWKNLKVKVEDEIVSE